MSPDRNLPTSAAWLSEEDAHRVLARAVELDARQLSDVSLTQLQEVASEAGIGSAALEQALRELAAGKLERSLTRPLSERLAHFRRHAASLILIAVAAATPGDLFVPMVVFSLPLIGLYELGIRVARAAERRGPPRAPKATNTQRSEREMERAKPSDHITRSLMLRPA
jgi:hypothetical protein